MKSNKLSRRAVVLGCLLGTLIVAVSGCKTVPGANVVRTAARAGGSATGIALNLCDIDAKAGAVITNVMSRIGECQPHAGETLEDAWVRVAQTHTDILVARGDLTAAQGAMVMAGFRLAVKGYDLLLVYYPSIGVYAELTAAAVDGFVEGFLAAYQPNPVYVSTRLPAPDGRILEAIRESREFKMMERKPFVTEVK